MDLVRITKSAFVDDVIDLLLSFSRIAFREITETKRRHILPNK